jgi:hypothetical protein
VSKFHIFNLVLEFFNPTRPESFRINPKIQFMWGAGKVPVQQCFDPSKYEYDFSLEYSVVQSNLS